VEHLVNFVQKKSSNYTGGKKTDFSEKFQTRKKLDSESTDFFSDFLNLLRMWRILSHSSTQLSYISNFSQKHFAKLKEIRHKRKQWKLSSPKLFKFWYSLSSKLAF
jgi:hypothetical protein